jgi:hypothetical protein
MSATYSTSPVFVAYIRSIVCGVVTAKTVHDSIIEGSTSLDIDGQSMILWNILKAEMGEEVARDMVTRWLKKPWNLK